MMGRNQSDRADLSETGHSGRTRRLDSGRPVVPAPGLTTFSCGGRYRVASPLVTRAAAPDRGSWEDCLAGRREEAGMGTWGTGPFDNDTAADFALVSR
jgi:hypothetical protein